MPGCETGTPKPKKAASRTSLSPHHSGRQCLVSVVPFLQRHGARTHHIVWHKSSTESVPTVELEAEHALKHKPSRLFDHGLLVAVSQQSTTTFLSIHLTTFSTHSHKPKITTAAVRPLLQVATGQYGPVLDFSLLRRHIFQVVSPVFQLCRRIALTASQLCHHLAHGSAPLSNFSCPWRSG
jgi:hypothetical protein